MLHSELTQVVQLPEFSQVAVYPELPQVEMAQVSFVHCPLKQHSRLHHLLEYPQMALWSQLQHVTQIFQLTQG